ncbi:MAG: elongation factor P [Patescibacteria group bacterium]|nr:elongation factor P [Patescibacteria group bacterium]
MLNLSEIKLGKIIEVNNEPFLVVGADHHKMGRGGAILKVKLKNLITGNTLNKTFQGNDKATEADTEKKKANYMYKDETKAYLMDNASYEQFEILLEAIGEKAKFLKDGIDVDALYFNGNPVAIDLPIKMEFKVISAPPGVKGNSAGNVTKQIELEGSAAINAPLFVNEGDVIRVNTDTGEYVERV